MIISKLNTSLVNELHENLQDNVSNIYRNIHDITNVNLLSKLDNELWGTLGEDFRVQLCNNLKNEL